MEQKHKDFLDLFQDNRLTLTNGMEISDEVARILEQITDVALSHDLAPAFGGACVEMVNRDGVLNRTVPHIIIVAVSGELMLLTYELRLIPFAEIIKRFEEDMKPFQLFMSSQKESIVGYRHSLSAWGVITVAVIEWYCGSWLPRFFSKEDRKPKLAALRLYCQLATNDGYMPDYILAEIESFLDTPAALNARKRSKK